MSYRKKRPIRQGQLISPWGIGQMIPFPEGDSLMIAGMDAWERQYKNLDNGKHDSRYDIQELRLERRLGVKSFRLPPDYNEDDRNNIKTIPAVRFPRWHYCKRCGAMEKVGLYDRELTKCKGLPFDDRSCHEVPENRRLKLIPVRFVVLCPKGHIDDFPFLEWVHVKDNKTLKPDCQLRYKIRNASSSLGAIKLFCSCGAKSSMHGSFNPGALKSIDFKCSGCRPWLGEVDEFTSGQGCSVNDEDGGKGLIVAQKGASNVYFPNIVSSLYIPGEFRPVQHEKYLDRYWGELTSALINDQLIFTRFEKIAVENGLDPKEFYNNGVKRYEEANSFDENVSDLQIEKEIRDQEFNYLTDNLDIDNEYLTQKTIPLNEYGDLIKNICSRVSLVTQLRETRAFTGFSRINSSDGKNLTQRKRELALGKKNWLPAITVSGEGIFLNFNSAAIDNWSNSRQVLERSKILDENYAKYAEQFGAAPRKVTPGFVLVHTLSHILINELSLVCGYGSSSLRERIYANEDSDQKDYGVLIYTASGDSEGSLGGLVKQGLPLKLDNLLYSAINKAGWCSVDPICIESPGQGLGSCNLSACHNCVLLPETSCEQINRLLDRAMLVGTLDNQEIGFFNQFLK